MIIATPTATSRRLASLAHDGHRRVTRTFIRLTPLQLQSFFSYPKLVNATSMPGPFWRLQTGSFLNFQAKSKLATSPPENQCGSSMFIMFEAGLEDLIHALDCHSKTGKPILVSSVNQAWAYRSTKPLTSRFANGALLFVKLVLNLALPTTIGVELFGTQMTLSARSKTTTYMICGGIILDTDDQLVELAETLKNSRSPYLASRYLEKGMKLTKIELSGFEKRLTDAPNASSGSPRPSHVASHKLQY
ncbi:hypothetical protein SCHPADRAFT_887605 [Schizopora paradoxa]|uniref:Uncharacterized protein n=1 Tax=Schizopora paradoxa TaxID=27342 RepID=A0A0H2RY71_9AGAM|nr:hypothetical protein SCHPADRAFT_887605 [Schizopora paradoxa]